MTRADLETGLKANTRAPGARVAPAEPDGSTILGIPRSLLLVGFMTTLFIPGVITVAGLRLAPSTIFMLVMIVPAFFRILNDPRNRVTAVDVLLSAYVLWCGLVIFYHYGPSRAVFIVNQTVTMLGGYIMTRAFVRSAEDYRLFFRCFLFGLLFYLPFVLIELVTRRMLVSEILGIVLEVPPRAGQGPRLGLWRVQGFLPHSILFGLFCSIGIANFYYIHARAPVRRTATTGLAAFMAALSLSSAPTIGMGVQFILIAWDRVTRLIPGRWIVLTVTGLVLLAVIQLSVENGIFGLVIENFAYDEMTGWGRTEILQYSSAEVARNPIFGIGLGDWVRPYWRKPSVDNFWLLTAMRYGIPSLALLWLGLGLHAIRLMTLPNPSEEEIRYRTGHLIAWVSVFLVLWTVHIWDAAAIFIMAYAGAGAWLYTRETPHWEHVPERTPPRTRPRAPQTRTSPGADAPYSRAHLRAGQAARHMPAAPGYTRDRDEVESG